MKNISKLSIVLALVGLLLGCGDKPPADPCADERELSPQCEATSGEWVVASDDVCGCVCPKGTEWKGDVGCVIPLPPPPPKCDNAKWLKDNCEFGVKWKKCECKPEPVDRANPKDYVRVERVEDILFWQSEKWEGLFAYRTNLTWAGNRDLTNVVRNCPVWGSKALGSSDEEFGESNGAGRALSGRALVGQKLSVETNSFIKRFWLRDDPNDDRNRDGTPIPNKRCDPDAVDGEGNNIFDPAFLNDDGECTRTNVRKKVYSEFKDRMLKHNNWANDLRGKGTDCKQEGMGDYDSIAGWCGQMDAAGYTKCPSSLFKRIFGKINPF